MVSDITDTRRIRNKFEKAEHLREGEGHGRTERVIEYKAGIRWGEIMYVDTPMIVRQGYGNYSGNRHTPR